MIEANLDIRQIVIYWIEEAEEALTVAEHLYEKGDYSYGLFFGHLAVEKMLKGVYVHRKQTHAPPIHNLVRLAQLAGTNPDEGRVERLALISSFNIEARYPDLQRSFRKKCTQEFASENLALIKETLQWLKAMMM
jgi:HEPN domain-containing protein